MPKRNSPATAFRRYADRLEKALRCVSSERLLAPGTTRFETGRVYFLVLNNGDPVTIRGSQEIHFSAGQHFRVVHDKTAEAGPYRVHTVKYWYHIADANDAEILTYHWDTDAVASPFSHQPHLHVGSSLIADSASFHRKDFSKLHIPTGRVSLESVIHFLITELGAEPQVESWEETLAEGQFLFDTHRRVHVFDLSRFRRR